MSKNKKVKNKKQNTIVREEHKDGSSDIYISKSPTKSVFGRIVVAILALSMVLGVVAGLIIVILQAAGVFN